MNRRRSSTLVLLLAACLDAGCNRSAQRFDWIVRGGLPLYGSARTP